MFIWIGGGIICLLFLLALLFGLLQTRSGKRKLMAWVASRISSDPDRRLILGELHGLVPFDIRLDTLAIHDREGTWLSMESVLFCWSPWALFQGRIHVRELRIGSFHIERRPDSKKEARPKGKGYPAWPPDFPPFFVERFHIGELALGESLFRQRAAFAVDGTMRSLDDSGALEGALRIQSKDRPQDFAEIAFGLKGKGPIITLNAKVEEGEGGLIAAALDSKVTGLIAVELKGEGPVDAWKGNLKAEAEGLGAIETGIELSATKTLRVRLEGRLQSMISTPLGDELLFAMDMGYEKKGEMIFHAAGFKTHKVELRISGELNLKEEILNAAFDLQAGDIARFKEMIHKDIQGNFAAQGSLSGPIRQPNAMISLWLTEPSLPDMQASSLIMGVQVEFPGPLVSGFPGLILKGNGVVEGFSLPERGYLRNEYFDFKFAGRISPLFLIHIKQLDITGQGVLLRLTEGELKLDDLSFKGAISAEIEDLKRFHELLGRELAGTLLLNAHLVGDGRSRSISADIQGHIRHLSPIPSGLEALISSEIDYKGRVDLKQASRLRISDLKIDTSSARLNIDASIDLLKKDLQGKCQLVLPELAVFSSTIKRPIKGRLNLDVDIEGPFTDPRLRADANIEYFSMEGIEIDQGSVILHSEGLQGRSKGDFQIAFQHDLGLIHTKGMYTLSGNHLMLSNLTINAPGVEAKGDLRLNLDGPMVQGTIQGNVHDLSQISGLLKEEIKGRVGFKTNLSGDDKGQSLTLDLYGTNLESHFGNLAEVILHARFPDVFHEVKGDVDLDARMFSKEKMTLETVSLSAEGDMKQVLFSLEVKGVYHQVFELRTQGTFISSSDGEQLELALFQGSYADYPIHIETPLRIIRTEEDFSLDPLDFRIGKGFFHIASRRAPETFSLDTSFKHIPLEMLHLFGFPDLYGSAEGGIQLEGAPDSPKGTMALSISDIQLKRGEGQRVAPVHLNARADLGEGQIQAEFSLEGLTKKPVMAKLLVPVDLSLSPFMLSVYPKGELQGQIQGEANLSAIPEFFFLEDQTLEGLIRMGISVAGKVEAPIVDGTLEIYGGAYENTRIGTIIKDIQILIKGDGQSFVLEKAEASDGLKGAIRANGSLRIASNKDFQTQLDIAMQNATLVRSHDLTAMINGHLALSGSPDTFMLNGSLQVGPAELQIPERLPPEITEIEVIEINWPGDVKEQEKEPQSRLPARINLDLKVDIPGRVFIRGRGLDSEWKGSFNITGNAREPSITGQISVVRGNFNMFGKRFALSSGSIAFDGIAPPNPGIDVTAENRRSDLTARIRFSGNPSSLNLTIESDPMLPPDEVLARVLFGRSVSDTTPIQALRLAQAMNALTGRSGVLDVMGRTRKFIGLDQLDIKQSEEGTGETTVSVGKYLADGVYIEMEKGVGTNTSKVSAEVELTPNITLESETGSDSEGGVGLNWKWDY